ncbi:hypothetical protein NECAME_12994 [Necator americanus]|uniref:DUF7774 domain-containing protein n=1 Tax=Necator americanus TaxID=51031 RepID=W2SXT5_NECAM|nr:hypothetical protein NECAME_12994 [Necator americanus]ETN74445.1 hypothetical protein NECAME_12994 [Necator americanus]
MDQEGNQNKRLREMFRLFQRAKKQKEKVHERGSEEEQKSAQIRQPPSPSKQAQPSVRSPMRAHRTGKIRRKNPYMLKKLGIQTKDEEVGSSSFYSQIRENGYVAKRYDRNEQFFVISFRKYTVPPMLRDDIEEFENVAVALRPAHTKMRKAKLRWKTAESPTSLEKTQKDMLLSECVTRAPESAVGTSWDELTLAEKAELDQIDPTQLSFDEDKPLNTKYAEKYAKLREKPQEKVEQLLKEIYSLLLRIDELEQAQSKYIATIKKLTSRIAMRDKKLSEEKMAAGSTSQSSAEKEKVPPRASLFQSPQLETVALRGLDIMKRNQLLEQTVNEREAQVLANFFESEESKPNKMVIMLIDKALTYGIEVVLMRPDLFEDYVDNELRLFLIDGTKAKHTLLDCMLLHPEYVPVTWGGNVLAKRHQERQRKAETPKKEPEKSKAIEENAVIRTTRSIIGYLLDASKCIKPTTETVQKSMPVSPEKSIRPKASSSEEEKSVYIMERRFDVKAKTKPEPEAQRKIEKTEPKSSKERCKPSSKPPQERIKPAPKTEAEKRTEKVEPKSEAEKRIDKQELKSEAEKRLGKPEQERGSDERIKDKELDETRSFAQERWKYRKHVQKTPKDTAWVQKSGDRRIRDRAKAKVRQRQTKKN